jgi:hypothetical protein
MLICFLAYSSTLKIKANCSSVTSVDFQRTTQCYVPRNRTLYKRIYRLFDLFIPFVILILSGFMLYHNIYIRSNVFNKIGEIHYQFVIAMVINFFRFSYREYDFTLVKRFNFIY